MITGRNAKLRFLVEKRSLAHYLCLFKPNETNNIASQCFAYLHKYKGANSRNCAHFCSLIATGMNRWSRSFLTNCHGLLLCSLMKTRSSNAHTRTYTHTHTHTCHVRTFRHHIKRLWCASDAKYQSLSLSSKAYFDYLSQQSKYADRTLVAHAPLSMLTQTTD